MDWYDVAAGEDFSLPFSLGNRQNYVYGVGDIFDHAQWTEEGNPAVTGYKSILYEKEPGKLHFTKAGKLLHFVPTGHDYNNQCNFVVFASGNVSVENMTLRSQASGTHFCIVPVWPENTGPITVTYGGWATWSTARIGIINKTDDQTTGTLWLGQEYKEDTITRDSLDFCIWFADGRDQKHARFNISAPVATDDYCGIWKPLTVLGTAYTPIEYTDPVCSGQERPDTPTSVVTDAPTPEEAQTSEQTNDGTSNNDGNTSPLGPGAVTGIVVSVVVVVALVIIAIVLIVRKSRKEARTRDHMRIDEDGELP